MKIFKIFTLFFLTFLFLNCFSNDVKAGDAFMYKEWLWSDPDLNLPGTDKRIAGIAGFVDVNGVTGYGAPGDQYLFFMAGNPWDFNQEAYVYKIKVDCDSCNGDPTCIQKCVDRHPRNPDLMNRGTVATRTLEYVSGPHIMGTFGPMYENAFYVDDTGIYYGASADISDDQRQYVDWGTLNEGKGVKHWDFGWIPIDYPVPIASYGDYPSRDNYYEYYTQGLAYNPRTEDWWVSDVNGLAYKWKKNGTSWWNDLTDPNLYEGGWILKNIVLGNGSMEIVNDYMFTVEPGRDIVKVYNLDENGNPTDFIFCSTHICVEYMDWFGFGLDFAPFFPPDWNRSLENVRNYRGMSFGPNRHFWLSVYSLAGERGSIVEVGGGLLQDYVDRVVLTLPDEVRVHYGEDKIPGGDMNFDILFLDRNTTYNRQLDDIVWTYQVLDGTNDLKDIKITEDGNAIVSYNLDHTLVIEEVEFTATNNIGKSSSDIVRFIVENNPPTANITCDNSACGFLVSPPSGPCSSFDDNCLRLDNSGSFDPDGNDDILKFEWRMNVDGGDIVLACYLFPGFCNVNLFTFTGNKQVDFYLEDNFGYSDLAFVDITIYEGIDADFRCSADNASWWDCEDSNFIVVPGDKLYLKDNTDFPVVSPITRRLWYINGVPFALDGNLINPTDLPDPTDPNDQRKGPWLVESFKPIKIMLVAWSNLQSNPETKIINIKTFIPKWIETSPF